ncbi:Aldo/keto reductase [Lentithecium fluviatile CBS 122367]|uniref:Aldo/keto reductase n=1 Tax=Lentithecium fluviatile CBS 122367 TaxID=1168545 RepID=A0A6G1J6Q4_9PLEO|nr:Aldo/keto reductase [Lentithecium fluviatile CBS 122367]
MAFPPPPKPVSLLGRHRILSPTAGVRVSPLCLGAMNFGDAWKDMLGECNKETSFAMLDHFYSQGGNFIDTAVNYQFGESEQWLGEWMEVRGRRDEMVIATKFTGSQTARLGDKVMHSNYGGNGTKNLYTSIERSLKNLRTSYIDLYYVHLYDFTTSIPELMHALNDLCTARKVLYLGISDCPAWIVVKANCYARQHGLRPFSVYQGRWSAACRDFEREIIPMCIEEGLALAPWGVLGGGGFKSKEEEEGRTTDIGRTGKEDEVRGVLEGIAKEKGTGNASVALAYVMHKAPYVFPIVGGRKISHLTSNIEALGLRLSPDEIDKIDNAYGFEIGFPHDFVSRGNKMVLGPEDNAFNSRQGYFDYVVRAPRPIAPHQGPLDRTGPAPLGMKDE